MFKGRELGAFEKEVSLGRMVENRVGVGQGPDLIGLY